MSYASSPALSAITQEMSLNREGLVADCIFPPVKTDCKFGYIDWTGELKDLKSINDHVTCKSDANEIDTGSMEIKYAATKEHALMQVLDECCVTTCGQNIDAQIAAQKTRSLSNSLLIGREERAIKLATDESKYENNVAKTPSDPTAIVDGGLFNLDNDDFVDPNFDLVKYFAGINDNAKFGHKNVAVMSKTALTNFLTHPKFIGSGCVVDPKTTIDRVAALLGVSKICVADANYNDGIGDNVSLKKLWPSNYIFFASSYDLITSQDPKFSFGLSAHTQQLEQNTWLDEKKGKGKGAMMQKIGHDLTEVVLSYKAATLVKLTA